jgi:copper chaperone CopZ
MAESNFVTTHELSLVSDSIVRDVTSSTIVTCTKIAVDDISDDMSRALDKIKAITVTMDGIARSVDTIESTVDDIQHSVENIDGNSNTESMLEDIQETLSEIKGLLSARGYGMERRLDTWMETIDRKIDSNHAELYNALAGGLRLVYDPALAVTAKKQRDQDLLRHLVEAGIMKEDASV